MDAFFEIVYNRERHAGIIDAFNKVANDAWKRANAVDGRLEKKEARKIARAEVVAWIDSALAKSPADFGDAEPVEVAEPVASETASASETGGGVVEVVEDAAAAVEAVEVEAPPVEESAEPVEVEAAPVEEKGEGKRPPFAIPTIHEGLRQQVENGEITLKGAGRELYRAGWYNFIPGDDEVARALKLPPPPSPLEQLENAERMLESAIGMTDGERSVRLAFVLEDLAKVRESMQSLKECETVRDTIEAARAMTA